MDSKLERFINAQDKDYLTALNEIKSGKKRTHWIWYIFPQLVDLGHSNTAKYYGIKDEDEAREYLNNNFLRNHLIEISEELYKINDDIKNIMGYPDDLKVKSSITLFHYIDPNIKIFKKIIDKFYNGEEDEVTLDILRRKNERLY